MASRTCANCGEPIGPVERWSVRPDGKPVHQACPAEARLHSLEAIAARLANRQQLTDAGARYVGAELDDHGPSFRFASGAGEHEIKIRLPGWDEVPAELLARGVANHVLLEIARRRRDPPIEPGGEGGAGPAT